MKTVQELATDIVAREGGFVNDPADSGGATNHGVTLSTLRRLGLDITKDSRIDEADVRALSQTQAVEIFVEHYFRRPGIGNLPEPLQPSVFDMYVNAGSNAVKVLQRLLSQMGFACEPDGQIGPQTITAAQSAFEAAIITIPWQMRALLAVNLPAAAMVAKVGGSSAQRTSFRKNIG